MKRTAVLFLGIILLVLYGSCSIPGGGPDDVDAPDNPDVPLGPAKYGEQFWGEWIRMDTGETWYITGDKITVHGAVSGKSLSFTRNSEQVLSVSEAGREDPYYLFASRIANSSFSAKLVFIDGENSSGEPSRSVARDYVGSNPQTPPIIIGDKDQPYKGKILIQPDPETGEITIEDIIPGDNFEITIDDPQWKDVKVELVPFDGQDMGIIPLTHGVNLKPFIRTAHEEDDIDVLYADGVPHDFIIGVENIGTTRCVGANYKLTIDEGDFTVVSGSLQDVLDTIVPGGKKEIQLRLACKPIDTGYAVKKIGIEIQGGEGGTPKTWEDSVSLKFYKAKIPFRFSSLGKERLGRVQGVVITPRGKTYHFATSQNASSQFIDSAGKICYYHTYSMDLPWSSEDYLVAFSGATVDENGDTTEARYSLGIDEALAASAMTLSSFTNTWNYEPNDMQSNATPINNNDSIVSYLFAGDIDYYRINLGDEPPTPKFIELETYDMEDLPGGYWDGQANPGDTMNLDIKFKNYSGETRSANVTGLSVDAAHALYVNIIRGTSSYPGYIPPNYYATLTSADYSSNSSGAQLLNSAYISRALQFEILPDCPPGTMTLTVRFTDNYGVVSDEEIDVEVVTPPINLVLDSSDGACTVSGDNDEAANPGESFTLGVKVKNTGTRNAAGVTAKLSKESSAYSSYLTINTVSAVSVGSLDAEGASGAASFSLSLFSSCPAGADIPLQLEITNSEGNKWYASFTLHVYPPSPAGVQAAAQSESAIGVSWSAVTGASGYKVYNGDDVLITTVNSGSTTSYTHTGLTAGTVYAYRVSATVGSDESSKSAAVSAKTWTRFPAFNKAVSGTVSAGIPEYYRFPVSNGVTYTFTSNKAGTVVWEDGTSWFSLSSGTQTRTPSATGWAVLKLESAGAYSLTVKSGEAAVSDFAIGSSSTKTINETDKTIAVLVPYGTNLANLTPTVTPVSGWTCVTTGAQNFNSPVEYRFAKDNGAVQVYTVTEVIRRRQGGITITPPGSDISIAGFPASSFTVSRTGSPRTITITDTSYSSYEWYVNDAQKNADSGSGGRAFTVKAVDYPIGAHTLTLIVYKNGVPYSNERRFTVAN
jgi:hypothetical protein